MLLVLAFGLVAQPVLGAMGEVHELTAHADTAGGHTGHHAPHASVAAAPADDTRDAGAPMHELLHYAHCCGHAPGLAATGVSLPTFQWIRSAPDDHEAQAVASSRAATPFRPPISA